MKKVFAILAVAGVMAACNSGENKEAAKDSTATVAPAADSAAKAAADTTKKADTAAKAAVDTTKKK
ncbi:hypothetical protein [Asinibacterium sp. OR53]|jgi:hypothetical protein|uniref:hypothetical protein n=1 Tax=Asinibacterium sp. OR53 TaxID=925409 RepID=UPI000417E113|nr:hypothetical protein [Asinibacterium sp. OR53]